MARLGIRNPDTLFLTYMTKFYMEHSESTCLAFLIISKCWLKFIPTNMLSETHKTEIPGRRNLHSHTNSMEKAIKFHKIV